MRIVVVIGVIELLRVVYGVTGCSSNMIGVGGSG